MLGKDLILEKFDTVYSSRMIRCDLKTQIAFIEGFLIGLDNYKFELAISSYISNKYNIDIEFASVIEQLEHVSELSNVDIIQVFYEIIHSSPEETETKKKERFIDEFEEQSFNQSNNEEFFEIPNLGTVKEGMYLTLKGNEKDRYKSTKFFDRNLKKTSWDLFYPSDTNDFKHVLFYYEENENVITYSRALSLFDSTTFKIIKLSREGGRLIVYTEIFRVDLIKALESGELEIVNNDFKIDDFSLLEDLFRTQINTYIMGLVEFNSFSELVGKRSFEFLFQFKKKWHKYERSIHTSDINPEWHPLYSGC